MEQEMYNDIMDYLQEEVIVHRQRENTEKVWDRGFENGSLTEAIKIRNKIKHYVKTKYQKKI